MSSKKQSQKHPKIANPIEALKDIGQSTAAQMRDEITKFPQEFFDQIVGAQPQKSEKKYSGEITPGDTMEMNEVFSGQYEEQTVVRQQLTFERRLLEEERAQTEKKTHELKIQLKMIQEELIQIAQNTQSLATETEIATMQVAVDPGLYHVIFFEKLLEFVKSFRKKINQANVWLHSANKRAGRKGWVSNYKQHGAKYLLSGEHYVARSAG